MAKPGPIGVFDSGYGGLTVLKELTKALPEYDYLYLGDNARAPYGNRSFETVYEYTLECVKALFNKGCSLVILACNTASAKALRTIQQSYLPTLKEHKRVLGVIRPTTELAGKLTQTNKVGILGTRGTVLSDSYPIEIHKFYPHVEVFQQSCPMWVPLIENNEHLGPGADYFVTEYLTELFNQSKQLDTVILACTHYPLLLSKIQEMAPKEVKFIAQGEIVAASLKDYLQRHPEMDELCTKGGSRLFYTTDDPVDFNHKGSLFFGTSIQSTHLNLHQ